MAHISFFYYLDVYEFKGDFPEGSNIDFTNYFSKEVQTLPKSKLLALYNILI